MQWSDCRPLARTVLGGLNRKPDLPTNFERNFLPGQVKSPAGSSTPAWWTGGPRAPGENAQANGETSATRQPASPNGRPAGRCGGADIVRRAGASRLRVGCLRGRGSPREAGGAPFPARPGGSLRRGPGRMGPPWRGLGRPGRPFPAFLALVSFPLLGSVPRGPAGSLVAGRVHSTAGPSPDAQPGPLPLAHLSLLPASGAGVSFLPRKQQWRPGNRIPATVSGHPPPGNVHPGAQRCGRTLR